MSGAAPTAVQSLWVGDRLGTMERLGLASFVSKGHPVDLYAFAEVAGLPAGVRLRDAREILPSGRLFGYREGFGRGSWSAVSNVFRYKLLLERGGWWVDTDVVCLRPFAFDREHVLASEAADPDEGGGTIVSSCVLRQPAGSPLMEWALTMSERRVPDEIRWGEIGPRLLARGVRLFRMEELLEPPETFCPVPFYRWRSFVDPAGVEIPAASHAVHLWHQMWREHAVDPDAELPPASWFATTCRRVLAGAP